MIYVGIPNSMEKSLMVKRPSVKAIYVTPEELAWDCLRHVRFLEVFSTVRRPRTSDLLSSDYALWLRKTARTDSAILAKCRSFLWLYEEWGRNAEGKSWAVVTEDGLRLDGSHRAAVAVVLGKSVVPVDEVAYRESDQPWRREMMRIRDAKIREVAESIP